MIPEYPKFKPLAFEDLDTLKNYLGKDKRQICELNLANYYLWKDFDNSRLTIINRNLCILASPVIESAYFFEPLGNDLMAETVEICLKHAHKISRVSEGFVNHLASERYQIAPLRNQFDYIYNVKELAELKGKKFYGKRNHIKRFKKHFPAYKFVALEPSLKNQALELFEKWFEIRKESRYFPKLAQAAQKNALEAAFLNFDRLNLLGTAILVDDSLSGFILGSQLNSDTFCAHFMYCHPDLSGISQTLLWEACRKTFARYTFLNLEQVLGIPGIRISKLSYQPVKMEKKFEITLT